MKLGANGPPPNAAPNAGKAPAPSLSPLNDGVDVEKGTSVLDIPFTAEGLDVAANIVARKGFAPPRVPVAWGLRPTPRVDPPFTFGKAEDVGAPVGCGFIPPNALLPLPTPDENVDPFRERLVGREGVDKWEAVGTPVVSGVVAPDWGIGGRDSSNEAPKFEVGLNGFIPPKPVV